MDIAQFITENTVWLIVFGVLILMAMIGYMAEKNGKKEKKEKVPSTEKEKEQLEIKETEEPAIKEELEAAKPISTDVVNDIMNLNMEEPSVQQSSSIVENSSEDIVPETVTATGEDLTVPLESSVSSNPEFEDLEGVLPPDIEAEISALTAATESTSVSELTSTESTSTNESAFATNDFAVNDISSLFGETKKEESDNSSDVWKF